MCGGSTKKPDTTVHINWHWLTCITHNNDAMLKLALLYWRSISVISYSETVIVLKCLSLAHFTFYYCDGASHCILSKTRRNTPFTSKALHGNSMIHFVRGSWYIYCNCIYLCTLVKYDFHISWRLWSIPVTRRVLLLEKDIFTPRSTSILSPTLRILRGGLQIIVCHICSLSFDHCIVCFSSVYGIWFITFLSSSHSS